MAFAMELHVLPTRRMYLTRSRFRTSFPSSVIPSRRLHRVFHIKSKRTSKLTIFITRAIERDPEGSFTGDWPMNWSLASYEDMSEYYGGKLMKEEGMGSYHLTDIMSRDMILTTPTTTRKELEELFKEHTGLPVIDEHGRLLGVVSRSDLARQGEVVKELMSTPPIAAKPTARVADAACLMLKHKVHRIPIVDKDAKVIGFVTRTDIFEALEVETEISEGITS